MKAKYRALLMAGCMIGVALPAVAQPANLLTPLSSVSAAGQSPDAQFIGSQPAGTETSTDSNAGNHSFLSAAYADVQKYRWHAAEGELQRAETFILNGGDTSSSGVVTSPSPAMSYVIEARAAVKQLDKVDALLAIDRAMSVPLSRSLAAAGSNPAATARKSGNASFSIAASSSTEAIAGSSSMGADAPLVRPAAPMITKALLPGHWQLKGSQYHWVPPDTCYRAVERNPYIPGHYEYHGGAWVWVSGRYAKASG